MRRHQSSPSSYRLPNAPIICRKKQIETPSAITKGLSADRIDLMLKAQIRFFIVEGACEIAEHSGYAQRPPTGHILRIERSEPKIIGLSANRASPCRSAQIAGHQNFV
jgi:hypothetical protein